MSRTNLYAPRKFHDEVSRFLRPTIILSNSPNQFCNRLDSDQSEHDLEDPTIQPRYTQWTRRSITMNPMIELSSE